MLLLLYGPNSYSRSKKVAEIVDDKVKDKGLYLAKFDLEKEEDYPGLLEFLGTRSMFNPKRIGIVENVFEVKDKKALKKVLEATIEDKEILLILISDTKPPASFAYLLEKHEDKFLNNQHFPDLKKGEELQNFIKKEARARDMNLSVEEVSSLEEAYGANIWALVTELDKLALIGKREIQQSPEADYFKTVNAFKFGKSVKDKITHLETMLSIRGDEPAKIFNMLGFGYGTAELAESLADYDVMIKSGKLEYEEALLDIALK